jgi:formyl-CoA transferase
MEDPHVQDRGFIVEVDHPEMGPHKLTGPPWKMSETPGHIKRAAPQLGQDNEYVFGDLLGTPRETLADLTERGVLH